MVTLHSHTTRLGVLDIGSNTVHMLIVDAAPGARPEPEASTKSTIRLMQYLKDDGSIKKAGTEALLSAVEKAMKLAEEYEITQLLVLATSALREAPNGGKILRKIEEAIGQPVTVLSGVDLLVVWPPPPLPAPPPLVWLGCRSSARHRHRRRLARSGHGLRRGPDRRAVRSCRSWPRDARVPAGKRRRG